MRQSSYAAFVALVACVVAPVGCSSGDATAEPTTPASDDSSTDQGTSSDDGVVNDSAASDSAATTDEGIADVSTFDAGAPLTPGDPGPVDVTLDVRSDAAIKPISARIYGINGDKDVGKNRPTILRQGGNRLTAYNWENNASNAGSDWCFQNDDTMGAATPPGAPVKGLIATAAAASAGVLLTIPIVDYVAADTLGGSGPPSCSGDVRKSGTNYLSTRFKQNKLAKGSAFSTSPDTTDGAVYEDELVSWVKGIAGAVPVAFDLDNEPDLWSSTHAEVHPMPVGYDELVTRNVNAAKAIKAVMPTAKVHGFVSYGYAGYTTLQSAPDASGKGQFVDYYLSKMKDAEATAGKRLVDVLDLHWYPEAQGGGKRVTDPDGSDAVALARVQAPRSLWDPTYVDTTDWISRDALGGKPIRLVPWLFERIAAKYPGTELAISEWHYGGGAHISGAIATADVLGIFGREGVHMASIWWNNPDDSFTEAGLQAFRNYDGKGAQFGDVSIEAKTSAVATATVYASVDSTNPSRVVVVVINKDKSGKTAGLRIAHPTSFKSAKVWTLTQGGGAKLVPAADLAPVATNAFKYAMPGWSVSVIVPSP